MKIPPFPKTPHNTMKYTKKFNSSVIQKIWIILENLMIYKKIMFCSVMIFLKSWLGCDADITLIGNGFCNDETNNAECSYDGGDCCVNIKGQFCSECNCLLGGKITSPGYPQQYDNFLNTIWILQVPPGQRIQIHFLHLDFDYFPNVAPCR